MGAESDVRWRLVVSTTFEVFNDLFNLFWILGTAVTILVIGYILYNVIKYRDRGVMEDGAQVESPPKKQDKGLKLLLSTSLSAILLLVLIFGTFGAVDYLDNPPPGGIDLKVIGYQWGWKFVYPNGYIATGELRVPRDQVIRLWVTSEDVFHNFGILSYHIKTDAIPGQANLIWFTAREKGEYLIQCFELCGAGHAFMIAKLVVMDTEEFNAWYSSVGGRRG
ncbi:MAG: cytochrome c oxidase subunit II [Aigarchaeota archaeon]|nr:cytochrome c oxidase subunit II [Aigarchaeota archaeon]MDW8093275.1 cytochrome c oxidase subunit II [Nitrososphaerota archaeon]